jgi:hypothetical protein
MDDKKTKTEVTVAKKEPCFSLERLEQDCHKLFGVTPSTFAAATNKLKKAKKYTVAEIQTAIEKWRKTPLSLRKGAK